MVNYSVVSGSREKNILELINLATSTASPTNSDAVVTGGFRGFLAFIDATEDVAGTLDVKFQTKHPRLDQWFDIPGASIAQLSATGNVVLFVGAYIPAIANSSVPAIIGNKIRAVATLTGTWTYSVDLILVS
jgi:hypothetical protein